MLEEGLFAGELQRHRSTLQHSLYIKELWWLCWEAAANVSLQAKFPDLRENRVNAVEIRPLAPLDLSIRRALRVKFPVGGTGKI